MLLDKSTTCTCTEHHEGLFSKYRKFLTSNFQVLVSQKKVAEFLQILQICAKDIILPNCEIDLSQKIPIKEQVTQRPRLSSHCFHVCYKCIHLHFRVLAKAILTNKEKVDDSTNKKFTVMKGKGLDML